MTTLINRMRAAFAAAVLAGSVMAAPSALAQEISASHLEVARSVIGALKATDDFDSMLPQVAQLLAAELVQKNPNLSDQIGDIVQQEALKLAERRADVEIEAAKVYAKIFTEQELKEINAFYSSETGKKLLSDGPIATRELVAAGDIWHRAIARDLSVNVGKALNEVMEKQPAEEKPAEEKSE